MTVATSVLLLVLGLVILLRGANDLVEGASGLALRAGISPLVVGLTVVAFGTSAPELVTSVLGALRTLRGDEAAASIVVGNMLGSNSCNVGLILGLSALLAPIAVDPLVRRRDLPMLLGITALTAALAWTVGFGRVSGLLLLAAFAACTAFVLRGELRGRHAERGEEAAVDAARREVAHHSATRSALEVVAGLVLLVLGAWMLVGGAISLARQAGISEGVIGLTIVALGTSLPELATSIAAARRGESEIALGNVVGSNAFNLGAGIGLPATIAPLRVSETLLTRDVSVMAILTLGLALAARRAVIGRRAGALLLGAYAGYVVVCVVTA